MFRVPLHPVVPALFVLMCAYMLYSSIDYVRNPDYGLVASQFSPGLW